MMKMSQEAKLISIIGALTLLMIIGGVFLLSKSPSSTTGTKADNALLIKNDSHKISTDSAKVTFVEFGDYQCPACGAAQPSVKQLLNTYSGRVNFVFRHFPLPQHANAIKAAMTAEAAGAQGKYWEMHELLYDKQDEWSNVANPDETFLNYAKQLQLDPTRFTQDSQKDAFKTFITQDLNDGKQLGVNSTPTFYINDTKYTGSFGYDNLKLALDEALSR